MNGYSASCYTCGVCGAALPHHNNKSNSVRHKPGGQKRSRPMAASGSVGESRGGKKGFAGHPGGAPGPWPGLPEGWQQVLMQAEQMMGMIALALEGCDLSPTQYQVLAQLGGGASATLSQLSHALGCTQGNITGLTERMVAKGLIRRYRNPRDGRSSLVSLTDTGAERLERARRALSTVHLMGGPEYVIVSANRP